MGARLRLGAKGRSNKVMEYGKYMTWVKVIVRGKV